MVLIKCIDEIHPKIGSLTSMFIVVVFLIIIIIIIVTVIVFFLSELQEVQNTKLLPMQNERRCNEG